MDILTEELVSDLWENRIRTAGKGRKKHAAFFFDSYLEITTKLNEGFNFTLKDMRRTKYWQHLETLHKGQKEIHHKFIRAIELFNDVREHGIRDPLFMVNMQSGRYLYGGNHRLVIAKTLGIEKVKVLTKE